MQLPDMNLLPALDALLREASVTGAAAQLSVSASAMSRTLSRLRRVVGDPLLVPSGRGLTLTPRACELRPRVEAALAGAMAALQPRWEVAMADVRRDFAIRTNERRGRDWRRGGAQRVCGAGGSGRSAADPAGGRRESG
ncbi:helix-turn-helix domain-containing protein [Fodinicola feengrottensis]|uniref:helix-turn-helix domain-containing protein n=1 Tax=Fodinicola feengrottensis TaxID=435914 RepID=UPI0013D411E5|nr:LysR family transcriptional regulator [Fodinicola feengrottensis]